MQELRGKLVWKRDAVLHMLFHSSVWWELNGNVNKALDRFNRYLEDSGLLNQYTSAKGVWPENDERRQRVRSFNDRRAYTQEKIAVANSWFVSFNVVLAIISNPDYRDRLLDNVEDNFNNIGMLGSDASSDDSESDSGSDASSSSDDDDDEDEDEPSSSDDDDESSNSSSEEEDAEEEDAEDEDAEDDDPRAFADAVNGAVAAAVFDAIGDSEEEDVDDEPPPSPIRRRGGGAASRKRRRACSPSSSEAEDDDGNDKENGGGDAANHHRHHRHRNSAKIRRRADADDDDDDA
jgi:hypothetical protein